MGVVGGCQCIRKLIRGIIAYTYPHILGGHPRPLQPRKLAMRYQTACLERAATTIRSQRKQPAHVRSVFFSSRVCYFHIRARSEPLPCCRGPTRAVVPPASTSAETGMNHRVIHPLPPSRVEAAGKRTWDVGPELIDYIFHV